MTALEMQYNFQQKFVEMDRPQTFSSYDIEQFLNESQELTVDELSDHFEKDEKIRTYLYPITEVWPYTVPTAITSDHPNGIKVSLPSNYFRAVKEEAEVSINNRIPIKPQKHDYYVSNINNPFKKPFSSLYWRLDVGKDNSGNKVHEIITDGTTGLYKYHLTYLTKPTDISISGRVNCELNALIHPKIVQEAVNIALQSLQRAGMLKEEPNK